MEATGGGLQVDVSKNAIAIGHVCKLKCNFLRMGSSALQVARWFSAANCKPGRKVIRGRLSS
jgi:hypothetical protein